MICILNILYYHPISEATPNSKITGAYCAYHLWSLPHPPSPAPTPPSLYPQFHKVLTYVYVYYKPYFRFKRK
jgi:hypothetical protein